MWGKNKNGQFQKISVHHDGRLQYFNPPLPSEIPKCVTPPCPQNSIIVNPPSPSEFPFSVKPFGITKCVHKTPNLGYFTSNGFTSLHFCLEKIGKKKRFLLTLVQQLQPTEILHCTKLPQNIKIKISCDTSLYTRRILRSRVTTCFDTSAILNLSLQGQQSRPILRFSKWRSLSEKTGIHTTSAFKKRSKISEPR